MMKLVNDILVEIQTLGHSFILIAFIRNHFHYSVFCLASYCMRTLIFSVYDIFFLKFQPPPPKKKILLFVVQLGSWQWLSLQPPPVALENPKRIPRIGWRTTYFIHSISLLSPRCSFSLSFKHSLHKNRQMNLGSFVQLKWAACLPHCD